MKQVYKLDLSESQVWLITKGLLFLSSEDGEQKLRAEFPDVDLDALAADLNNLMSELERAVK